MATREISAYALTGPVAGLLDEMLACYVDWREDAAAAADAYRRWSCAPTAEESIRFAAYRAALEQEESAARSYRLAVTDVEDLLARPEGSTPDRRC
jgi:hypothetical protein